MKNLTKEINGHRVFIKSKVLEYNEKVLKDSEFVDAEIKFPQRGTDQKGTEKWFFCGVPVYGGNTYPVREELKKAGFVFDEVFEIWHPAGTIVKTLWN